MRFVYSDGYDLNLGDHIFPAVKFRLIRERVLREKIATPEQIAAPEPATDDQVRLVHDAEWVKKLRTGTLGFHEILKLEIPYSKRMVDGFWHAAGGSILAARLALQDGIGFNIGGGFHHGFAAHGEGFCAINDIAIAARAVQEEGLARHVLVVDCDVHHGNGTAAIFAGDPTVFTFSIHQFNNYPQEKPESDLDVHLEDGVGDDEYLSKLQAALEMIYSRFHPELVLYVAGADPFCEDQLGGLMLTVDGLRRRDEVVIGGALDRGAAVSVMLAGGYAYNVTDTVVIQTNTAAVARDLAARRAARPL